MTRRFASAVLTAVLLTASLGACAKERNTAEAELRAAMARTSRVPRGIVYTEATGTRRVEVRAEVEDDLRYQSLMSVDGVPVLEEVALDDALADRVIDDRAFALLARPPSSGGGGPAPPPGGVWVVDRYGAPSSLPGGSAAASVVDDPVLEALTAFRYVSAAITAGAGVVRFDPDDLDYRPKEDPFPRPKQGVRRYDIVRQRLPRPQDAVNAGARAIPGNPNFRKLSVYVRDGLVVQVLEQVELRTRLRELTRLYDLGLPAGASVAQAAAIAEARLNEVRRGIGVEPLRLRSMSLVIEPGRAVKVSLPADAIEGNLYGLRNRGEPPPNVARS